MSVKIDASGRRSVQAEVEVPGTPEQVWQAIATGPGVSSWFMPADIDEREGGSVVCHFGPGMDSVATVTAWDPPRRFAAESQDLGPEAPSIATEWIVEARSGGTCVVRVVHSLFASGDEWDGQLESSESGWPGFFRILRLYLTHFQGQRCSILQLMGSAPGPEPAAWEALTGALGLVGATPGERRTAPAGAPPLAGNVEPIETGKHPHTLLLRLDEPAPGIASLGSFTWGDQVHVSMSFYLYGDRAPTAVARDEPLWRTWMSEHFPAAGQSPCEPATAEASV
jgi:uncharacterized protein YndB with AHSA1/START domain